MKKNKEKKNEKRQEKNQDASSMSVERVHSKNKENKGFNTVYYYLAIMVIFVFLIILTPILQMQNSDSWKLLFSFFSFFCHQKFERSLCLNQNYQLGNCDIASNFIYQFPVCSRDISFYLAMLIGGFLVLFLKKKDEIKIPDIIWLILFIAPMAVDGLTQLFGLRESTNEIRIVTGSIAGIIIPFYMIPIINRLISVGERNKRKKAD
jgi:uncharacterized membrane protein